MKSENIQQGRIIGTVQITLELIDPGRRGGRLNRRTDGRIRRTDGQTDGRPQLYI